MRFAIILPTECLVRPVIAEEVHHAHSRAGLKRAKHNKLRAATAQRPGIGIVVEQGQVRPLGHEHDGVEAEGGGAGQEVVEAQAGLAGPDAGVTDGVQSCFHGVRG